MRLTCVIKSTLTALLFVASLLLPTATIAQDTFYQKKPLLDPVPENLPAEGETPNWMKIGGEKRSPSQQPPMRARAIRETVTRSRIIMEPVPAEELAAAKKLNDAVQTLKQATDDNARQVATAVIQEQLSAQFDQDVAKRETELAEVEQRVKTLREQLEKRKSLRDDIIGLRLKTIANDAAGLGFPGELLSNAADPRTLAAPVFEPGRGNLFEPDPTLYSDEDDEDGRRDPRSDFEMKGDNSRQDRLEPRADDNFSAERAEPIGSEDFPSITPNPNDARRERDSKDQFDPVNRDGRLFDDINRDPAERDPFDPEHVDEVNRNAPFDPFDKKEPRATFDDSPSDNSGRKNKPRMRPSSDSVEGVDLSETEKYSGELQSIMGDFSDDELFQEDRLDPEDRVAATVVRRAEKLVRWAMTLETSPGAFEHKLAAIDKLLRSLPIDEAEKLVESVNLVDAEFASQMLNIWGIAAKHQTSVPVPIP